MNVIINCGYIYRKLEPKLHSYKIFSDSLTELKSKISFLALGFSDLISFHGKIDGFEKFATFFNFINLRGFNYADEPC